MQHEIKPGSDAAVIKEALENYLVARIAAGDTSGAKRIDRLLRDIEQGKAKI